MIRPAGSEAAAFAAEVYVPLEEALRRVREDAACGTLPAPMPPGPLAVLARQVATPNFELLRFLDLAREAGLRPFIWEFHADRVSSRNPFKRSLMRPRLFHGLGRRGGAKLEAVPLADVPAWDGRPISDVRTLSGRPLVEVHREMVKAAVPPISGLVAADMSPWHAQHAHSAASFYEAFLRTFCSGAILFETFLVDGDEREFSLEVALSAVRRITATDVRRPLVCRLDPDGREGDAHWLRHPGQLAGLFRAPGKKEPPLPRGPI